MEITETESQALIVWAKGYIEAAERLVESNPSDSSANAYLKLLQLALASLTSEPEYNISYEDGEVDLEVSKARYDACHPDYRWISYEAPPAQILRPVELPDIEENESAFKAGLDSLVDCLEDCGDAEQGLRLALRSIREKLQDVKS